MASRSRPALEEAFPNIALWANGGGMVELGHDPNTDTIIRVIGEGGMVRSGASRYENLDDALQDSEGALGRILVGRVLGAEPSAERKTTRKRRARRKRRRDDGRDRLKPR